MIATIIRAYQNFIPCTWEPQEEQLVLAQELIQYATANQFPIRTDYDAAFIEAVNQKLDLNAQAYQNILDAAFASGVKLNNVLKTKIRRILDGTDAAQFDAFLRTYNINTEQMQHAFSPVSETQTKNALAQVVREDKKYWDVLTSIFSRYFFNLFDQKCTALFFSKDSRYTEDYFDYIESKYPDLFDRDCALSYIDVSAQLFEDGYGAGCNMVLQAIKDVFGTLKNHCDLAVYIPDIRLGDHSIQWDLYRDIVLFSEKHKKENIDRNYFGWEKIAATTNSYIHNIDQAHAEWEYAFQGFVFKDCFVTYHTQETKAYDLLLIFEKNVRDERPIHCPACRSSNIQGNSYPILNVRSWECANPLCPDRSRYNRGKRYSFMSLIRQKQMLDEENRISENSVAKWHLDCIDHTSQEDVFEMCLRHYSCVNDGVYVYTLDPQKKCFQMHAGRNISFMAFMPAGSDLLKEFKACAYFKRYICLKPAQAQQYTSATIGRAQIIHGDALCAMMNLDDNLIDGAVTSPPYYNAKDYSQWENIYCYLYDMYNVSKELYRILKPGAVYLFNIFDYFDNEKNIVLSAMGNKRMILGAYMLDIFARIGFHTVGNIIWYKGEVQGNRRFNQGNMTPYYQAPLNCWEHIFILSKGQPAAKYKALVSEVESIQPVKKIVRGKNVLGHTAPFPKDIPELLIKHMETTDTVIDPFLGSGTTCITANAYNVHSIGIELNPAYYTLSEKLVSASQYEQCALDMP